MRCAITLSFLRRVIAIRILFDFDDILNDLSKCWIAEMNRTYGTHVKFEDVKDYELTESFPDLSLYQLYAPYLDGKLYLDIHPVKEAQALVEHLSATDELYVCTAGLVGVNTMIVYEYLWNNETTKCTDNLLRFIGEYYPQFRQENIIICANKQMVDGDVLIDDNPAHLVSFPGARILLDKPYNRDFNAADHGVLRAKTYDEIAHLIEMIREDM